MLTERRAEEEEKEEAELDVIQDPDAACTGRIKNAGSRVKQIYVYEY